LKPAHVSSFDSEAAAHDRTIWAGWDAASSVSGGKGNKVLWIRPQGTQLKVTGRRLDTDAPPLKVTIPCCHPTGFH
jgi:hypothetical protein